MLSGSVLVISPHPDDETLGAGGTLLKWSAGGAKVHWLNVTDMKEEYGFGRDAVRARQAEISAVGKRLPCESLHNLSLRPMGLDSYPKKEMVGMFADVFCKVRPEVVIMPFYDDPHSDHRVVFEAAHACTKSFRFPFLRRALMMEIPSETDFSKTAFSPNLFIDISGSMQGKLDLLRMYKTETGPHPFPRSVETVTALALLRGAKAGCSHAEAFMQLFSYE